MVGYFLAHLVLIHLLLHLLLHLLHLRPLVALVVQRVVVLLAQAAVALVAVAQAVLLAQAAVVLVAVLLAQAAVVLVLVPLVRRNAVITLVNVAITIVIVIVLLLEGGAVAPQIDAIGLSVRVMFAVVVEGILLIASLVASMREVEMEFVYRIHWLADRRVAAGIKKIMFKAILTSLIY